MRFCAKWAVRFGVYALGFNGARERRGRRSEGRQVPAGDLSGRSLQKVPEVVSREVWGGHNHYQLLEGFTSLNSLR